jgi:gas vesicle protein
MPRQDSIDFLTAFAVGTALGIGATLLLQPKRTRTERIARKWKPYKKQIRRSYAQAAGAVREGAGSTAVLSTEIVSAGRELLGEFREEVSKVLTDARTDLQQMVEEQVRGIGSQSKRTRRKFGL